MRWLAGEAGPRVFGHDHGQPFLGRAFSAEPDYSDEIAREIDDEIRRIVEVAHQRAKDLLTEYRGELGTISEILVKRETIEKEEFEGLLAGKTEEEVFGSETPPPGSPIPGGPEQAGGAVGLRRSRTTTWRRCGVEARGLDLEPELARGRRAVGRARGRPADGRSSVCRVTSSSCCASAWAPPSGQRWDASARCALTAAAIASLARANATKKASPSVWTSRPSCSSNAVRSRRRCSASISG